MNKNRREFIKELSLVGGGVVALGLSPWLKSLQASPEAGKKSPSDRVRIGVIGTGSRGQKLMLHLKEVENVEIVAVCDIYPPNLEKGKG